MEVLNLNPRIQVELIENLSIHFSKQAAKFDIMPLRDHMIKKCILLSMASILCLSATFAQAEEVVVNNQMKTALKKFNNKFVIWETIDYSPTIQKYAIEEHRTPYALNLDVNGDKNSDLVLDGHDDKNNLLICLLSTSKGYDVILLRQNEMNNPKELESMNDGVKEMGFNYYLWPNKPRTGFTLAYPQQSDINGNLLDDGAVIEYIFKDGEFQESYQTL